jgi:uncharacterized membrane protein (UPF0182 family)
VSQKRLGMAILVLALLFAVARIVGGMALDFWWFDTVTDTDVWATRVGAQVFLAIATGVVTGLVLIGSTLIAHRTPPAPRNGPNRVISRYRDRMGPAHGWILVGAAIFLTLRAAANAMARWKPWLLFLHGENLDTPVPGVGWDLGYHLFKLPFLEVLSAWLRGLVIVAFAFALIAYVANGAIRLPRAGRKSARRATKHLGYLAAAFALLQALDYVFVRWPDNGTAHFGAFDGAGFTQLTVVIPGLLVLAATALITAIVTVVATRASRLRPIVFAFVVWGVLQALLIWVIPTLVNRFVVEPAEAARELEHISSNLDATRAAYSLGSIEQVTRLISDGLDSPPDPSLASDIDRVPLFTEASLVSPLQVLQGTTGTRITDVDLDRYEMDGSVRPVLIAARNANRSDLPEQGWVQQHLVYTHGDGVVAVPADSTSPDGRPDVDAFTSQLDGVRPELYFGENLGGWYVIVGTDRTELGGAVFDGDTAIPIGSMWRRLALSLTVGQIEPLFSAELGEGSELLYRRGVEERLGSLATFLTFDANPYPVVADGRITWVVDGYTSSNSYPYAQFARNVGLPTNSALQGTSFNYMHASIKATVDAYDGTVHLYRTEVGGADDPILDAWEDIFPGLIEPIADMPESLRSHLLYPQDMLTVQTAMLGRYHVSDAETLFNGSDSWAISAAAGEGVARQSATVAATETAPSPQSSPAPAVSLFMPSSEPLAGHWVAIRPYGPGSANNPTSTRDELAAIAIADHDDPEKMVLVRIEVDSGRLVSSPSVAQAAIDTDDDLAALFTLLNANGSAVQFGPMTPIPLNGALVWVRSIVVTGTAQTTAPSLYGVAAVSNGIVGQAGTTATALDEAVGGG